MSPPEIYLFLNDKITPMDYEEVRLGLENGEISEDAQARIDGLKGLRGVREAMVWSLAKLLQPVLDDAKKIVARMVKDELQLPYARQELKRLFIGKNIFKNPFTENFDDLGIVLEVNSQLRREWQKFENERETPQDVLNFYPAWELFQIYNSDFQRDWKFVWEMSGGKIFNGKMVARKDDPVWLEISDFGFPFPPFSFDLGMYVREIDVTGCKTLGIPGLNRDIQLPKIQPLKFVGVE